MWASCLIRDCARTHGAKLYFQRQCAEALLDKAAPIHVTARMGVHLLSRPGESPLIQTCLEQSPDCREIALWLACTATKCVARNLQRVHCYGSMQEHRRHTRPQGRAGTAACSDARRMGPAESVTCYLAYNAERDTLAAVLMTVRRVLSLTRR